jgi:hypothetical protein
MTNYIINANQPGTMSFIIGDDPPYSAEEIDCIFIAGCGDPADAFFILMAEWTNSENGDYWIFKFDGLNKQPPAPGSPSPDPPMAFDSIAIIQTVSSGTSQGWNAPTGPVGTILWIEEPDGTSTPWVGDWVIRASAPDIPNGTGGDSLTVQVVKLAFTTETSDVSPSDGQPVSRLMDVFRRRLEHKDHLISALQQRLAQKQ